jgi:phosphate starvation-inducible PhoH-like protein
LKDVEGIHFSYFTERDVVRHLLVKKIIKAFEEHGANGASNGQPANAPPTNSQTSSG